VFGCCLDVLNCDRRQIVAVYMNVDHGEGVALMESIARVFNVGI